MTIFKKRPKVEAKKPPAVKVKREPKRPETFAIAETEGSPWVKFDSGPKGPPRIWGILFADGSVWDAETGWNTRRHV